MICPKCGQENPKGVTSCKICGASLKGKGGGSGRGRTIGIAVVGLLILVICLVLLVAVVIPAVKGTAQILVVVPVRDDEYELFLLRKVGQDEDDGLLLAEDVGWARVPVDQVKDGQSFSLGVGDFGTFVPGTDQLLLWYDEEGDLLLQQMRAGDSESSEVLDAGDNAVTGIVFGDYDLMFLIEDRGDSQRCYVVRPGGDAERVAKGDACGITPDGGTVYTVDQDANELTLTMVDTRGEDETTVLDEVEGVASYQISSDGSHVAYVQQDGGESQLILVERDGGREDEIGDAVDSMLAYGFLPQSDVLYYIVREDYGDDEMQLFTSEGDRPVAEGVTIIAEGAPDGRYLAYVVVDDDGDETLYVLPVGGDDEVEVMDGDSVDFAYLSTSPTRLGILVTDDDGEIALYSAGVDGEDVVTLLEEDDMLLIHVQYVFDDRTLYVWMLDEDNADVLFVTSVDREDGYVLLDEWQDIILLNRSPDGRQLLFDATEDYGDDPVLYSIAVEEGADAVELDDDADGYYYAVFAADGRSVLYTVATGSDYDDLEIRQVPVNGSERPDTLYREMVLIGARWGGGVSFISVPLGQ